MKRFREVPEKYYPGLDKNIGGLPKPLEIQLGYDLITLVDEKNKDLLLDEIEYCRKQIYNEFGLPMPPVIIRDNMVLKPNEYAILLNGIEADKSSVKLGHHLCIVTEHVDRNNENTGPQVNWDLLIKETVFGYDCFWVHDDEIRAFDDCPEYKFLSPEKIIRLHLHEIIRMNRTKFMDQNMVNVLIENVRVRNPDVISDVFFMNQFSISDMKILLNRLLEEEVSIRDMNTILETVADYIKKEKRPLELAKFVRKALLPTEKKEI